MIFDFLRKVFSPQKFVEEPESLDFEELATARDEVNFLVEEERTRYVTDYLERLKEVQGELDLLEGEYEQVTGYLSDLETMAELPGNEKKQLEGIIDKLLEVEKDYQKLLDQKDRMDDDLFYSLKSQARELEEAISKIREAEHQENLIKQDLKRLDREKQNFRFRIRELENMMANYKGMAMIFIVAFVICAIILMVMQFGLKMNALVGFCAAVLAFSVAMTVLAVKYMDADKEYGGVLKARKRLVRLTNTVKIRYVNNTNLLSYYYLKYHTESGKKLEQDFRKYQKEVETRRQFSEAESKREELQNKLFTKLSCYQIRYPRRLSTRPECILDHKEQVEQRHSLILRRQALRKQIEYNRKMSNSIEEEIRYIIRQYPKFAAEIYDMVNKYGVKKF